MSPHFIDCRRQRRYCRHLHWLSGLVEEIVLIVCRCKVILSSGLASERFTVADLLKVIQPAGDTLIAVAVEGVQVDTGSAVNAGVDFGAFKDRLSVCIHDAGSRCAVGVDEVAVLVSLIIRSFQVTVTERCLDGGEGRNGLAIALQLALTFLIRCLNGCLDLCNRSGIRLRDDKRYAVLWSTAVDALRIPDIRIAPSGVYACDYLCRNCYFVCHDFFLLILR